MKKFKVQFIRVAKVIGPGSQVIQLAEQIYICDSGKLEIKVPEGYGIVSVLEYLPDEIQTTDKG